MRRLALDLSILQIGIVLFVASAILGLRASYDPVLSQITLIALFVGGILYFLLTEFSRGLARARAVTRIGVVLAAGVALLFIGQWGRAFYTEVPPILHTIGHLTTFLPFPLDINENGAATLLEMALPLSVALLMLSDRRRSGWLWFVLALLMGYALLLTYSRGAWFGLVGAAAVTLLLAGFKHNRGRWPLLLAGLIVIIGIIVVFVLTVNGNNVPFFTQLYAAAQDRLTLYGNSLRLALDYPFTGIGPGGTFAMVYSRFSLLIFVPFLTYSHNLWLAIWLGQGLLGLVAFVLMVIFYYVYCLRVLRRHQPGALFYGAFAGVTATLLHGLVDARQYVEGPWAMAALFFGMAITVISAEAIRPEFGTRSAKRTWGALLAGVAIIAFIAGLVVVFQRPLLTMWYTNLGALDENRADATINEQVPADQRTILRDSAIRWYQQALALDPTYPNANRRLGNLALQDARYDEAIRHLEIAAAAEPTYQATVKGLGLAYVWAGRMEDAAVQFTQLADVPEMTEELYSWAQFRVDQNQPLLSAYALETAQLLNPAAEPNLNVWALIGQRYQLGGDAENARRWFDAVLAQDSTNLMAQTGLAQLSGG
jgi:putative inorganic carbon (hco3(-)) transporter